MSGKAKITRLSDVQPVIIGKPAPSTEETIKAFQFNNLPAPSEALQRVYARVENGIRWLADHDQSGVFHFWYESQVSRFPMPSEREDPDRLARRTAYAEYANARDTFEKLWKQMVTLEKREGIEA